MVESKKFRIAVLGCRTNQYEAQGYRDQLIALGWQEAGEGESADLSIVNSCTVTQAADSASRREIRKLARTSPGSSLVVTGCLASGKSHALGSMAAVSHIVPNSDKENLLKLVLPPSDDLPEFKINRFEGHSRAFVKVQDGCNSFCTYCIIPYVRGRSKSRNVDSILSEIDGLVAAGYKEVVITGINVGDFVGPEGQRLASLVRAVDQIDGLERLRLSSIDPDEVDDDLLDAICSGKRTCPSMHIVLQSGSNAILKRMNRKYTRQIFLDTVSRLRAAKADFTFTTDVIFGFPGESESDFQETLDTIEEVGFAKVHYFPYSKRERTRAALFGAQIDPHVMATRRHRIRTVSERTEFNVRERFLNRRMPLLLEDSSDDESSMIFGHTPNFLKVALPRAHLVKNSVVNVDLIENQKSHLIGSLVS